MSRRLAVFAAAVLLATHSLVQAGDADVRCDKRAAESDTPASHARLERFYSLEDLIKAAYEAEDLAAVKTLATEYLDLAAGYRCDWNYGNAIHDANEFLGLASLKAGDRVAAAAYLVKAGKSEGSPQLNTFGPDLALADALLKEGEVEPVKTYLKDLGRFWSMDGGRISEWLASIEKGERPELNRFPPGVGRLELAVFCMVLAWPVLAVAGLLHFRRNRLSRKWLFAAVGLVSGYLAMILAGWGSTFVLPVIIETVTPSGFMFAMVTLMGVCFLAPFLAAFAVSQIFVARKGEGG
jgi:hypothetical protein